MPHNSGNSFVIKSCNAAYISSALKAQLPEIRRTPYLHFVLDFSKGTDKAGEGYARKIQQFIAQHSFSVRKTKITFANFQIKTNTWHDEWQIRMKDFPTQGGFYLDRVLKSILVNNYDVQATDYPVIIVLTPNYNRAVISDDFSDLSFTFPESDYFYELGDSNRLIMHSLTDASFSVRMDKAELCVPEYSVRVWPDSNNPVAFLRNDPQPNVILLNKTQPIHIPESLPQQKWMSGLIQHGVWLACALSPQLSDATWPKLVKLSRETGILNRFTVFTVLENQAQWEVLKRKEKESLAGKHSLDVSENPMEMSEPSVLLIVICLVVMLMLLKARGKFRSGRLIGIFKPGYFSHKGVTQ